MKISVLGGKMENKKSKIITVLLLISAVILVAGSIWDFVRHMELLMPEAHTHIEADFTGYALLMAAKIALAIIVVSAYFIIKNNREHKRFKRENWKMNAVVANLPGAVISVDFNTRKLMQASEGFTQLTGFTVESYREFCGGRFKHIFHPDDYKLCAETIDAFFANKTDSFSIQYRILCKDGGYKWVMDRTNKAVLNEKEGPQLCSMLIDINEQVEAQKQLEYNEKLYSIIVNQTDDIAFTWDLENDAIEFSEKWKKKFGYPAKMLIPRENQALHNIVKSCDRERFVSLLNAAARGENEYNEETLCIKRAVSNKDIWVRIRMTTCKDASGKPTTAVGVIQDISEDVIRKEELREKAEKDSLTGLYNKGVTESRMREIFAGSNEQADSHAVFVIDIDEFKTINDTFGHQYGDAVLSDIASRMLKTSQEGDICGRIGGDEFMLLLKNADDRRAEERAKELLKLIATTFAAEKSEAVSGSIGYALYPGDGKTFRELYSSADKALYAAKNKGKNRFIKYTESMQEISENQPSDTVAGMNDRIPFEKNISRYIVEMMRESKDLSASVNTLLRLLGSHFGASRAMICELCEDGVKLSGEWCSKNIESANLQGANELLSTNDLKNLFDERGLFVNNNVLSLNGNIKAVFTQGSTKSAVFAAIIVNDVLRGAVGFTEKRNCRVWKREEVLPLVLMARLIGSIMAITNGKTIAESLGAVENIGMLVTDDETAIIEYVSDNMKNLYPNAAAGECCYKCLHGLDERCPECIIAKGVTAEYNAHSFVKNISGIDVESAVCKIAWGAEGTAHMVVAHIKGQHDN